MTRPAPSHGTPVFSVQNHTRKIARLQRATLVMRALTMTTAICTIIVCIALLPAAHGLSTSLPRQHTGVWLSPSKSSGLSFLGRSLLVPNRVARRSQRKNLMVSNDTQERDDDGIIYNAKGGFTVPSMLLPTGGGRGSIPGESPEETQTGGSGILQVVRKRFGIQVLRAKKKDATDDEESSSKWWQKIPFVSTDSDDKLPKENKSSDSIKKTFLSVFERSSSSKSNKEKPMSVRGGRKTMEKLQKQLEANQKRQLKLIEQIRRDEAAEELALVEEREIAAKLAVLDEEQRRNDEERMRKKKEVAERKRASATELNGRSLPNINPSLSWPSPLPNTGLADTEKAETESKLRNKNPPSVAQKFLSSRSEKAEQEKSTNDQDKESLWSSSTKLVSGMWDSIGGKIQEEWVPVMPKTRMFPGEVVPVQIGGIDLLVIASRDGKKLHCLANSCSHLGTPLELGLVESRPVNPSRQGGSSVSGANTQEVEDCIICPLHHTAFALDSGDVRGEWCPYPPVIGAITASLKPKSPVAVFDIRTKGKNIEVCINSSVDSDTGKKKDVPVRKQRGSSATRADQ